MAIILDYLFIFILGFVTGFTWTRYYVDDLFICVLMGLLCALLIESIVSLLFKKHFDKKNAKKVKADKARGVAVMLYDDKYTLPILATSFEKEGCFVTFYRTMLLCEKEKEAFGIVTAFAPHSEIAVLRAVNICKRLGVGTLKVFSASSLPLYDKYAASQDIKLCYIDINAAVTLLEQSGFETDELPKIKEELPMAVQRAFSRSRSKYYFIGALFLALTSFIAFFPIYYIVGATVLFAFAVYSRFGSKI